MFNIIRFFFKSLQFVINHIYIFKWLNKWIIRKIDYNKCSPFFIIGAPRSGSTLLYQLLVKYTNTSYLSNFMSLCYTFPAIAIKIELLFFKKYNKKKLKSNFGYVQGIHSPSEAGPLINSWFGKDILKINNTNNNKNIQIKKNIKYIEKSMQGKLLIKSLKLSLKIDEIIKLFKNSMFIYIARDPFFTAQSIILTKRKLGIDINNWWSYPLHNTRELLNKDPYEMVVLQVKTIHNMIDNYMEKYPDKFIKINYHELCTNTEFELKRIELKSKKTLKITERIKENLNQSDKLLLDNIEVEKLNYYVKLHFN
jgi:hypothetical protein